MGLTTDFNCWGNPRSAIHRIVQEKMAAVHFTTTSCEPKPANRQHRKLNFYKKFP